MARANVPLLSFNRGIVSPKALARVDLDRMRLSAQTMTNWLPKTQGAMTIRPGTKYLGSSRNDTGAAWVEFVASTDEVALLELTHRKMRVWVPSDTGNTWETPVSSGLDVPLARPAVNTTVTLTDTGWSNTSTGGVIVSGSVGDVIPTMTSSTTNGVTISASPEETTIASPPGEVRSGWLVGDDDPITLYQDTGEGTGPAASILQVDFTTAQAITSYSIRAPWYSTISAPSVWQFQRSSDNVNWTTEDTQGSETGWGASEKRTYTLPGADTGTVEAYAHWRFRLTDTEQHLATLISEVELFNSRSASQVRTVGGARYFNATSIGALARLEKRVLVSDTGTEHSLAIDIERGPITLRVGSTARDDDYIRETELGTGYHNLAFNPLNDFYITLESNKLVDRIVRSLTIGDSGTVEVTTFIDSADLANVRYDQSADVVYVDCEDVHPNKIERRGTGRSWSFVKYQPTDGPFVSAASSAAKLSVSDKYGNTTLNSDIPFFKTDHVGTLIKIFHTGQSGVWPLGALNAKTDAIKVVGISDTGDSAASPASSQQSERRIDFSIAGTYSGRVQIERSFDGPDHGFHAVSTSSQTLLNGASSDTGTFTNSVNDRDDNSIVWYRARLTSYTSGVAVVTVTYRSGGVTGIARILARDSNTQCRIETLRRFSDTGPSDSWQEGMWSDANWYPSAVALHDGRLAHAGGSNIVLSVSDNYESFDEDMEGDAGPIIRTLGSGPVDNIYYIIALLRLIVGTAGSEMAVRSSSIDEPLTPTNSGVRAFSTQGSANLRAVKLDTSAIFAQRSAQRLFMIGFGQDALGDYTTSELTVLAPDLLEAGIVSIAVQRQPDTRIHCVLANGKVGILTFEPKEEVICWSMWETDGAVEQAMVLPGTNEDKVYYHIRRTINGATKRYLERWAMESECLGDTGLSWLADCAKSYTDTGRTTALTGFSHLAAESAIVWSDDTGQSYAGKDQSYDTGGTQKTYTVSGAGGVTLTEAVHHAVVGLPYTADWLSTKLAYAAQAGTALAQMKRTDKIAFVLHNAHNNGLYFGSDTGNLDPLPRMIDGGAEVDPRKIFSHFDQAAMAFPGLWDADSRIHLRAKAPRPVTVLAGIPTVGTSEKI